MENILSDFEVARRLHEELNGIDMAAAVGDVIVLSDDDEVDTVARPLRFAEPKEVICYDNQQAITVKREKSSLEDYYMPSMATYIDLRMSNDWALINMAPNLQHIFDGLKQGYFKPWLSKVNYTIKWDETGIISDNSCFKIFEQHKEILVSTETMIRPRIELISVLLHILIHFYLNASSKGSVKINMHDENFREIMLFLNRTLKTEISTFHKFHYSPEEVEFPDQWYQCTGICLNYEPFHGVVRCSSRPSVANSFWKDHAELCGGEFFKIFEITRLNVNTNHLEKKYVRNVRYMFPKPHKASVDMKRHPKNTLQVRELFDLTDDNGNEAKVENLCEVVNLDDSEFNIDLPMSPVIADVVKRLENQVEAFAQCHICKAICGPSRFKSHVDSCRGFQKKVEFGVQEALIRYRK